MKKFLLFVSVAAMSLGAAAQTLPTGEVYIRNVQTGMWLNGGYGWGTNLLLREQGHAFNLVSTGIDCEYTIKSSFGYVKLDGDFYVDADEGAAAEFSIMPVEGTNYYTIDYLGDYLMYNGESGSFSNTGTWPENQGTANRYAYWFIGRSNDDTDIPDNTAKLWEIVTREDRIAALAEASDANPMEASFLIKASSFERNDADNANAWVSTFNGADRPLEFEYGPWWAGNDNDWLKASDTFALFNIDYSSEAGEAGEAVVSQEITDAPEGTYEATYRVVNQVNTPLVVNFNDVKAEPTAGPDWDLWWNSAVTIMRDAANDKKVYFNVGSDGKLSIQLKKTVAADTQNRYTFKDCLLKYLGKNSEHAGVEGIAADVADADAPVEYFNMQGMRVAEPTTGLYIVKQGSKVTKQLIRK